jgi:hypothetical protein
VKGDGDRAFAPEVFAIVEEIDGEPEGHHREIESREDAQRSSGSRM